VGDKGWCSALASDTCLVFQMPGQGITSMLPCHYYGGQDLTKGPLGPPEQSYFRGHIHGLLSACSLIQQY
jgi:hypothetical protein